MMPAEYASGWFRFSPRTVPSSYQIQACKLWWKVKTGTFAGWTLIDVSTYYEIVALWYGDIIRSVIGTDCTCPDANIEFTWGGGLRNFIYPCRGVGIAPAGFPSSALGCCFVKRTSKIGRSGVGRIVISPTPQVWLTGDRINDAGMAAYTGFATDINEDFTFTLPPHGPVTIQHCLHSLQDNDLTPIDYLETRPIPTTLYRRRFRGWP